MNQRAASGIPARTLSKNEGRVLKEDASTRLCQSAHGLTGFHKALSDLKLLSVRELRWIDATLKPVRSDKKVNVAPLALSGCSLCEYDAARDFVREV